MIIPSAVVCLAFAFACYGWVEAGWLRAQVIEVSVRSLPFALDGLRIAHLSDFHLGARFSRGGRASARAVRWVAEREPDIVCITGDLVSHPRGEPCLRELLDLLERPFIVLGNHDVAVTRDPFSRAAKLRDLRGARLLGDEAETIIVRDQRISVVGVDPRTYRARAEHPDELSDRSASLRILLCHFPSVVDRLPADSFDLILTGHLHGGQIVLPLPRRGLTLAHPRARFVSGVYETTAGTMHVSSGTGTTFIPFRFFAPPKATEIVLRRGSTSPDAPT
jgi:predicted MPP superfamily phosphohydrolase